LIFTNIFSTNSSDSHSVLKTKRKPITLRNIGQPWYPGEFGWQHFLLYLREDKLKYMAVTALQHLLYLGWTQEDAINEINAQVTNEVLQIENPFCNEISYHFHIGHQSFKGLPRRSLRGPYSKVLDWEFWHTLTNYIIDNESIIILGGNDNCDPEEDGHTETYRVWQESIAEPIWGKIPNYDECGATLSSRRPDAGSKYILEWRSWGGKVKKSVVIDFS
jgi:hypothetical protein